MPVHVIPTAPLAPRVLLPGDPGRALRLAKHLLTEPRMFNHHRGLWGYTGTASDGGLLTVQSTGMGGPSAAIVTEELCELGATALIRVGTAGSLDSAISPGALVVATRALARDGASQALGAGASVPADATLTGALRAAIGPGATAAPVVSTDLYYEPDPDRRAAWAAEGAVAVELELAAVLQVAVRRGARAAGVLAIVGSGSERLGEDELYAAELRLGDAALPALLAEGGDPAGS